MSVIDCGPNSPTHEQEAIFLTPEDVSRTSGMSKEFVLSHCRKNNPRKPILDAYLIGGKYRFSVSEVQDWIAAMKLKRS
jgi:hypothetical protein